MVTRRDVFVALLGAVGQCRGPDRGLIADGRDGLDGL